MTDLFPQSWLNNTLFDDGFIAQKQAELAAQPLPFDLSHWLEAHFDAATLAARNEAQLEEKLIAPLLAQLGWTKANQVGITVQGKFAKPDYCLLLHPEDENALIANKDHALITAICESKAWDKNLDTGKADQKDNPHHQLQFYLSTMRVRFGFLTNGRIWRVYDTDKITAKKTFLEFDLAQLLNCGEVEKAQGLALFAFFFARDTYLPTGKTSAIQQAIAASHDFTLAVEENLKAVIYGYAGEDSIFEMMGRGIADANPHASLADVYEHSVILLFRLLFVVYFEDKNRELLSRHRFYANYSLFNLFNELRKISAERDPLHDGIFALKKLFEMLDQGAGDIDIPLFNGGLFDPARAPLLLTPKIFDNATLRNILEKLRYKTSRGTTLFDTRRDFKNMSVTHLGRIYEGLLEFRFERATETAVYLEYESSSTKGKSVEAYFDSYDLAQLRKEKSFKALREIPLQKGAVYLKSASNSRKTSASYYTPPSLSQPLVKAAVDHATASGKRFTELKILDNACGSGHFLVEALGYLTDLALAQLEHDADLQKLVHDEREKIAEQLRSLNLDYLPEDAQILKRALLKRCIFGVDLNPFAVELARLSLWMDSFIFGTPLSFIEHHVQHGNALMGATVQDFIRYNAVEVAQNDLFVNNLGSKFDELRSVMHELDALRDTTAAEVDHSKKLWKNSIAPKLNLLSRALSFICTRRALLAENDKTACQLLDKTPDLLKQLFNESKSSTKPFEESSTKPFEESSTKPFEESSTKPFVVSLSNHPSASTSSPRTGGLLKQIETYARRYRFFHYEVAFPEAFAGNKKGFDIIVGNPPWDKTKFADTDFFPQYHSNYRSLKNTEKAAVQKRLLESEHIAAAYQSAQRNMEISNEFYKAAFPLNKGAGDGNLFRFFVERNLGLLSDGGSLNYVLPSALLFEEGSMALRQHIFTQCQMPFFWSFENRNGIFPDVDSRYKFALMQVVNSAPDCSLPVKGRVGVGMGEMPANPPIPHLDSPLYPQGVGRGCKGLKPQQHTLKGEEQGKPEGVIDTAFYLLDPAELRDPARHIAYPLITLKKLSPQQWALMELRDGTDLPILQKCYAAFPALSPDWLDFRNELHMTADKALFMETFAEGRLPLFEGKMIWQFSHVFDTPQYWLDKTAFDARLKSKELHRMAQDLGITKAQASQDEAAIRFDREFVRIGFRAIARDTDERTLIFALLPKNCGAGNSVNISIPKKYWRNEASKVVTKIVSPLRLLFALAWLNSIEIDWMARLMIQINVNQTYLYRLPMPQPSDDEIRANADFAQLAKNALLLSLAADWDRFAELAPLFELAKTDVPQTDKACDKLRAENDKIVAKLYGISDPEFAHLLQSFKVMAAKRPEYLALLASVMLA